MRKNQSFGLLKFPEWPKLPLGFRLLFHGIPWCTIKLFQVAKICGSNDFSFVCSSFGLLKTYVFFGVRLILASCGHVCREFFSLSICCIFTFNGIVELLLLVVSSSYMKPLAFLAAFLPFLLLLGQLKCFASILQQVVETLVLVELAFMMKWKEDCS